MTICVYLNSLFKRAETSALLDSGATENFINPGYARELKLPIEELAEPRKVFNVDGTQNRHGQITHYTDLDVRTGDQTRTMRFFLTNLGEQKVILGYPWFAAVQPVIDWAKGWIAYEQLPVVIKARISEQQQKSTPPVKPAAGLRAHFVRRGKVCGPKRAVTRDQTPEVRVDC
jgi:hypothetical protein